MQILLALLVLFLAVSMLLVSDRVARFAAIAAILLVLIGGGAALFLFYGPRDYMTRFPHLGPALDPYDYFLFYALGLACGVSLLLGFLLRKMYRARRT